MFELDPPDRVCKSCGGDLHPMDGQFETSEMIDVVEVEYRVVKNTLVKLALKGTAFESKALDAQLKGPTGIAWSFEDPSAAAKVIKTFRAVNDANGKLEVKCGIVDARVMPGAQVESVLATMPGKNELRAMLLATMQAPAANLVRLLQAPGQNLTYLMDARKRQLEAT